MLWALFTVAFYGFFRTSELIPSLCWSTITLSSVQMSITLLQSKTDPFRRGSTIHLFPTDSSTCPIKAMTAYAMHVDTSCNNPVFRAGIIEIKNFKFFMGCLVQHSYSSSARNNSRVLAIFRPI